MGNICMFFFNPGVPILLGASKIQIAEQEKHANKLIREKFIYVETAYFIQKYTDTHAQLLIARL